MFWVTNSQQAQRLFSPSGKLCRVFVQRQDCGGAGIGACRLSASPRGERSPDVDRHRVAGRHRPDELTPANVKDGTIKYKTLRKNKLQLLCGSLLNHIEDLELELRLEKAKVEEAELRLEEELKEAIFVYENGTDAPSNGEDNIKGVVDTADATPVEEGDVNATSSKVKSAKMAKSDKLAKLAKFAKLAKSTDLWCLSPYVPLSQEAKDKDKQKQSKVCAVNLREEVCTVDKCGNKHTEVCLMADLVKGKIHKATCTLWHMQIPLTRGNSTGNSSNNNARPAKPDKYLIKLEVEYRV
jgi:hypothetical protein